MIAPLLGLICALITYVLFRAGFIVVSDQTDRLNAASISPFIVALMAVASGLLSERAILSFRRSTNSWFGASGEEDTDRWAINLQRQLKSQRKTLDWLATRLAVDVAKTTAWAEEKEAVPPASQRAIAMLLEARRRDLFTDLSPIEEGS